jgi:hypothetical protein
MRLAHLFWRLVFPLSLLRGDDMADALNPVETKEHPRRFGVGPDEAILTMGREVEYRFPRRSQLATMVSTIVKHWADGDGLVRLYRYLYPYRDDFRRASWGHFTGSWSKKKIEMKVEPHYDDDDWAPTQPELLALPPVRPRSPKTSKPVPLGEEVAASS